MSRHRKGYPWLVFSGRTHHLFPGLGRTRTLASLAPVDSLSVSWESLQGDDWPLQVPVAVKVYPIRGGPPQPTTPTTVWPLWLAPEYGAALGLVWDALELPQPRPPDAYGLTLCGDAGSGVVSVRYALVDALHALATLLGPLPEGDPEGPPAPQESPLGPDPTPTSLPAPGAPSRASPRLYGLAGIEALGRLDLHALLALLRYTGAARSRAPVLLMEE